MSHTNPLKTWRKLDIQVDKARILRKKYQFLWEFTEGVTSFMNIVNPITEEIVQRQHHRVVEDVYPIVRAFADGKIVDESKWPANAGGLQFLKFLIFRQWTVRHTFAVHKYYETDAFIRAERAWEQYDHSHSRRGYFSFGTWRISELPSLWWNPKRCVTERDFDISAFK